MTVSRVRYTIPVTILDKLLSETSLAELPYSQPAVAIKKIYHSVQQDLENLLNTRRCFIPNLGDFVGLAVSILNYGMDNFWSMTFDVEEGRERLRFTVEQAIQLFEPRLKDARVFLNEENGAVDNKLSFRIEAYLNIEQSYGPIVFSSMFEPKSKKFLVVTENG